MLSRGVARGWEAVMAGCGGGGEGGTSCFACCLPTYLLWCLGSGSKGPGEVRAFSRIPCIPEQTRPDNARKNTRGRRTSQRRRTGFTFFPLVNSCSIQLFEIQKLRSRLISISDSLPRGVRTVADAWLNVQHAIGQPGHLSHTTPHPPHTLVRSRRRDTDRRAAGRVRGSAGTTTGAPFFSPGTTQVW